MPCKENPPPYADGEITQRLRLSRSESSPVLEWARGTSIAALALLALHMQLISSTEFLALMGTLALPVDVATKAVRAVAGAKRRTRS